MSEVVKIVFDIDTADVKTSTDELKALKKVTDEEVQSLNKLSATAQDAGDGFVSLRTRVKEAKEEAIRAAEKYGEFSKEAQAAKVKAGALADQMGDLNRQVNLLNPEAKAKAFSNLAQGVVGAFSIATGALQAFGIKNKEVEALAMKLQAALNITQGIASLNGLKESLDDLKVVLGFTNTAQQALTTAKEKDIVVNQALTASEIETTAANEAFTASLLTNPVFLLVAAIGALAGAMIYMSEDTEVAKTKVDLMTESQKALRQATNDSADAADRLAVAQGKLSDAQAQINKAFRDNKTEVEDLNEKIAVNNGQIRDNNNIIAKNQYALEKYGQAVEKNREAVEKGWKTQEEANKSSLSYLNEGGRVALAAQEANKKLTQSNIELRNTIRQKNTAILETVDAIKQEKSNQDIEKSIQENKRLSAEQERAAKERLRLLDELRKKLQENALADESDPIKRIQMAKQFANEEYALMDQRLVNEKASQEERDKLAADHTATIKKLDNDEVGSNKAKNDKKLAAEKKYVDALNNLALAKEDDPVKRAQLINDAKEQEIDDKLAIVEKGSLEEKALLADKERYEIEASKRVTEAMIEQDEKRLKSAEATAMARYEREKEAMDRTIQATNELMNTLMSIQSARYNQETIDAQKQKEQGLLSEEEYQKKLKEIKHRQDVADKNAAIFKATLDFASAMINALKAPPLAVPAQLAFTAAIAGLNLAKIIATPLPKYAKGTLSVPGTEVGKDSVHAMLMPGEAVIPTATNRAYHPTIKAIYEKKISASEINSFVMSRTKGGNIASNVTASVDSYELGRVLSRNKGVQIENANLVGKAIARELGSRINVRQSL